MSRSGYSEDGDNWQLICWRGAVTSATKGKRGQAFLKELLVALEAMPVKELIAEELEFNGQFCALGVIGKARGIDMSKIEPDEPCQVSKEFNIAKALAQEVVYMNDEALDWMLSSKPETPEQRWSRMREWVLNQIIHQPPQSIVG